MNPKLLIAAISVSLICVAKSLAAYSVGYVGNHTNSNIGGWITSSGNRVTNGGVSVGYFSVATPTAGDWTTLSSLSGSAAWSTLVGASYGFRDIRNVPPTPSAVTWAFTTNASAQIAGTVSTLTPALLPSSTQLFVLGFDGGSYSTNSPSGSYLTAVEWGAISDSGWLTPADLGSLSINFKSAALVASDVKVGSLAGNYATSGNVQLVPEPSTYALLVISGVGFAGYMIRRRRRA